MLIRFSFVIFLTFFSISLLKAQNLKQTFFGSVLEIESLQPVAEAHLKLENVEVSLQTITDSTGNFSFEDVPPGRYSLAITHIAYNPRVISEIYIRASRPERISVHLQLREYMMQEAEIQPDPVTRGTSLNSTTFTIEETQRFPASFFDPARMMTSQPGVTTSNDQANQLVIHGQSPNFVGWQLEGAEILNPNHLPNAGTFSDRSAPSGGGVNILSGQLMDNSRFYSGALPSNMGNSIAGIFDISLREGSQQQRSHTLQASLLGIDLATEGPIKKAGKNSYLMNYRYSTVGLLSEFGVNFGNEEIKFQDFSFHLNFKNTKAGNFSIFGLGGLSSNKLFPLDNQDEWETDKDRQEVQFEAGTGAIGIRQDLSLSSTASLTQTLAYSTSYSDRRGKSFDPLLNPFNINEEKIQQNLLSYKGTLNKRHHEALSSSSGLAVSYYDGMLFSRGDTQNDPVADINISYATFQPFTEFRYRLSTQLLVTGGMRLLFDSHNETVFPEPRAEVNYGINSSSSVQLFYNLLNQPTLNQPYLFPAAFANGEKQDLVPIRSHYAALGYEKRWEPKTNLKTKLFYQSFDRAPVSQQTNRFSALNTIEELAFGVIDQVGTGQVYGIDASLQQYFVQQMYYLFSISVFDATYLGADGNRHNMRFNSKYVFSLTGGKEWTKEMGNKLRITGINLKGAYRGGYWHTPIDIVSSREQNMTIFNWERPFEDRLPAYFSLDIRLSHTKQKTKYLRTWSVDIQNLMNRQNVSWYYYDQLQDAVKPAYQLGIIPVLGYRIEF